MKRNALYDPRTETLDRIGFASYRPVRPFARPGFVIAIASAIAAAVVAPTIIEAARLALALVK